MVARNEKVFTTDQVTRLLGLDVSKDKWRVIKFAQSAEYGISPSISEASGPGSRRLYDIENVCEIALALRLLETGLRSKVIGEVLARLRGKERLSMWLKMEKEDNPSLYLGIGLAPKSGVRLGQSRLRFAGFFEGLFELEGFLEEIKEMVGDRPDEAILLVPVGQMFQAITERQKIIEQS